MTDETNGLRQKLIDAFAAYIQRAKDEEGDYGALDPEDHQGVAGAFGINEMLAMEIAYTNDEGGPYKETPEERHARMKKWIEVNLRPVDIVEINE